MSNRKISLSDWNRRHIERTEYYAGKIEVIYRAALKEATRIAVTLRIDPDKPFSFSDYPNTNERVRKLLFEMQRDIQVTIESGQSSEWGFSNLKNDALVASVLSSPVTVPPVRYMARNLKALAAFQARKEGGLGLSERVWKYISQFKNEIELGLGVGLAEGKSAAQISRDLRGYLQNPDLLFRRVRNQRGQLVLSQRATSYSPGAGVYRSSYKNAMRLARTEVSMAYRMADFNRWQTLDFVVGIQVKRSNNTTSCDICGPLAGRFPKDYVFRSNHPSCRCYAIPILATREELETLNASLLRGDSTDGLSSSNEVTDVHDGFTKWIAENAERLSKAKQLPYFVKDNPKYVNRQY